MHISIGLIKARWVKSTRLWRARRERVFLRDGSSYTFISGDERCQIVPVFDLMPSSLTSCSHQTGPGLMNSRVVYLKPCGVLWVRTRNEGWFRCWDTCGWSWAVLLNMGHHIMWIASSLQSFHMASLIKNNSIYVKGQESLRLFLIISQSTPRLVLEIELVLQDSYKYRRHLKSSALIGEEVKLH